MLSKPLNLLLDESLWRNVWGLNLREKFIKGYFKNVLSHLSHFWIFATWLPRESGLISIVLYFGTWLLEIQEFTKQVPSINFVHFFLDSLQKYILVFLLNFFWFLRFLQEILLRFLYKFFSGFHLELFFWYKSRSSFSFCFFFFRNALRNSSR